MKKLNFKGKRVLMRVDFNVPLDAEKKVTDDTRIRLALPTIKYVLEAGASVVLMAHLGRPQKVRLPDGSIDVDKFSLKPVAEHLAKLLGQPVKFCPQTVGKKAEAMAAELKAGEVLMLENTRFEPGEEKGDEELARKMAKLGDIYINDAFGAAHRAHASTAIVARYFPKEARSFGLLMEKELNNAKKVLDSPAHPFTAVVGGAKVSDKILLMERFLDLVDHIIIGGGMAYTFVKAQGGQIGNSLVEEDRMDTARQLFEKARARGVTIHLPQDSIVAPEFADTPNWKMVPSDEIPDGFMGLDIGEKAREAFRSVILMSKTIIWNGPMGVFEMSNFAGGTRAIALAVAEATQNGAYSLIGGGDSVAAINQMGLADKVSLPVGEPCWSCWKARNCPV